MKPVTLRTGCSMAAHRRFTSRSRLKGAEAVPIQASDFPLRFPSRAERSTGRRSEPIASSPGLVTNYKRPYAIQYNLSIERQVSNSTIVKFAYIGTQAHHLLGQLTYNPGNRRPAWPFLRLLDCEWLRPV